MLKLMIQSKIMSSITELQLIQMALKRKQRNAFQNSQEMPNPVKYQFFPKFACVWVNLQTTVPKLFLKFPQHLTGYHFDTWEAQVYGTDENVNNFNNKINTFKLKSLMDMTMKIKWITWDHEENKARWLFLNFF